MQSQSARSNGVICQYVICSCWQTPLCHISPPTGDGYTAVVQQSLWDSEGTQGRKLTLGRWKLLQVLQPIYTA